MTTIDHDHAVLLCTCGATLAQCRCTEVNKPLRVVTTTCAACRPAPAREAPEDVPPNYEARFKTLRHMEAVRNFLGTCIADLLVRQREHDQSKLAPPEVAFYDRLTALLRATTYGSPAYYGHLRDAGGTEALAHHYAHNAHHPEHHTAGVRGMTLLDLLEMLCDWQAAVLRREGGSLSQSLVHNQTRFGYGDELAQILANTAAWLAMQDTPHHADES
jgi:Family of unknown function (DUF5662)